MSLMPSGTFGLSRVASEILLAPLRIALFTLQRGGPDDPVYCNLCPSPGSFRYVFSAPEDSIIKEQRGDVPIRLQLPH